MGNTAKAFSAHFSTHKQHLLNHFKSELKIHTSLRLWALGDYQHYLIPLTSGVSSHHHERIWKFISPSAHCNM